MKKVFQGEIYSIWQWEQELFDGTIRTFEKIERPNTAGIIGVLPDQRIMLVWDEQPHREGVLTPSGGRAEPGETAEENAAREFLEETGYRAKTLSPFIQYKPDNKSSYTVSIFIGKHAEKIAEPEISAGERTTLRFFTFDEFLLLGQDPTLRDMWVRIMLLEAQIDPKKKEALYQALYE